MRQKLHTVSTVNHSRKNNALIDNGKKNKKELRTREVKRIKIKELFATILAFDINPKIIISLEKNQK